MARKRESLSYYLLWCTQASQYCPWCHCVLIRSCNMPRCYCITCVLYTLGEKATIQQLTTMLSTSENVLFPGHNHRYWWPFTSCWFLADNHSVRSSAPVVNRWLWPANRTFLEVDSMVVSWWIVAFLSCDSSRILVITLSPQNNVEVFLIGANNHTISGS